MGGRSQRSQGPLAQGRGPQRLRPPDRGGAVEVFRWHQSSAQCARTRQWDDAASRAEGSHLRRRRHRSGAWAGPPQWLGSLTLGCHEAGISAEALRARHVSAAGHRSGWRMKRTGPPGDMQGLGVAERSPPGGATAVALPRLLMERLQRAAGTRRDQTPAGESSRHGPNAAKAVSRLVAWWLRPESVGASLSVPPQWRWMVSVPLRPGGMQRPLRGVRSGLFL